MFSPMRAAKLMLIGIVILFVIGSIFEVMGICTGGYIDTGLECSVPGAEIPGMIFRLIMIFGIPLAIVAAIVLIPVAIIVAIVRRVRSK